MGHSDIVVNYHLRRSRDLSRSRQTQESLEVGLVQAGLADHLPENDPERAELMRTFRPGAEELHIGWLISED
jgi:hypothetical protein